MEGKETTVISLPLLIDEKCKDSRRSREFRSQTHTSSRRLFFPPPCSSSSSLSSSSLRRPAFCSSSSPSSSSGKPDYSAVGAARIEAIQSCSHVKSLYDACWYHWYRYHFTRGRLQQNCQHFFEEYRACILEELEAKGLRDLIEPISSSTPPPVSSSSPEITREG
ncbi:family upf0203 protein [Cystoisospora suis]|uniref:Family upf0203 protein n=1 Tax=Cystoisospora suis TaxID=483139 RepID=A0A2C6L9Q2_9APIC|nr:family upf0203 protein [Cystoisospora suis]